VRRRRAGIPHERGCLAESLRQADDDAFRFWRAGAAGPQQCPASAIEDDDEFVGRPSDSRPALYSVYSAKKSGAWRLPTGIIIDTSLAETSLLTPRWPTGFALTAVPLVFVMDSSSLDE